MERVGTLINKLQDQFNRQESADKLAITAQLLLAELQMLKPVVANKTKVAVVMPHVAFTSPIVKPAVKKQEISIGLFDELIDYPKQTQKVFQAQSAEVKPSVVKEVNELLINDIPEMNEHLKEYTVEVATLLDETPVKDLKKAISINDRYLFINHLFRGDENMYERSIKTINSFNIFAEAQYWIKRELKVKLSWSDENPTVQLFDQLVKRRFA
ncbi:hypothetical protein [Sediminibacterium sp.]|uniref:hypothetical protein n=1 Tax=Sediminibacterium sp. TaxID=1917865 RepID=UPI003F718189